jgi:glycosyltransferase involved in cell wall biosynthesis
MAADLPIEGTEQAFSGLAIEPCCARIHSSAEKLAEATLELLKKPDLANQQAAEAKRWVQQSHDWSIIVNHLEKTYQQCKTI